MNFWRKLWYFNENSFKKKYSWRKFWATPGEDAVEHLESLQKLSGIISNNSVAIFKDFLKDFPVTPGGISEELLKEFLMYSWRNCLGTHAGIFVKLLGECPLQKFLEGFLKNCWRNSWAFFGKKSWRTLVEFQRSFLRNSWKKNQETPGWITEKVPKKDGIF